MTTAVLAVSEVQTADRDACVRRFRVSGCSPCTPFNEMINVKGIPKMLAPWKPGSNLVVSSKRVVVTANPPCFDVFVHYVDKHKVVGYLTSRVAAAINDMGTGKV